MKDCSQSFVTVGAYSVLMRHELKAHDDHWKGAYEGLKAALKAAEPDLRKLGFANMELAEGERLMLDASREAAAGDFERAYHTQRMGHDSWREMLIAHKVMTPSDDDILHCLSAVHAEARVAGGSISKSLASLAVLGNWR